MKTNKWTLKIAVTLIALAPTMGCALDEASEPNDATLDGAVAATDQFSPLATFDSEGLHFASDEVAQQWTQEGPGVWQHKDGRRLIIGANGHQWAVDKLANELDALYAADASSEVIAAKEAALARQATALDIASASGDDFRTEATCSIGFYTGPSSPFFGGIGGAALVQLSCQNGTDVFTVDTLVCTGTSGCGSSSQIAVPDSIPRLWGSGRFGFGACFSEIFVSPPGIGQAENYTCG